MVSRQASYIIFLVPKPRLFLSGVLFLERFTKGELVLIFWFMFIVGYQISLALMLKGEKSTIKNSERKKIMVVFKEKIDHGDRFICKCSKFGVFKAFKVCWHIPQGERLEFLCASSSTHMHIWRKGCKNIKIELKWENIFV